MAVRWRWRTRGGQIASALLAALAASFGGSTAICWFLLSEGVHSSPQVRVALTLASLVLCVPREFWAARSVCDLLSMCMFRVASLRSLVIPWGADAMEESVQCLSDCRLGAVCVAVLVLVVMGRRQLVSCDGLAFGALMALEAIVAGAPLAEALSGLCLAVAFVLPDPASEVSPQGRSSGRRWVSVPMLVLAVASFAIPGLQASSFAAGAPLPPAMRKAKAAVLCREAGKLRDLGQLPEAHQQYLRCMATWSSAATAYALAQLELESGRCGEASQRLQVLVQHHPRRVDMAADYGVALVCEGHYQDGVKVLEYQRELPGELSLHASNALGFAYAKLQLPQDALRVFLGALRRDPSRAELWNNAGVLAALRGATDQARKSFARAVLLGDAETHRQNLSVLQRQERARKDPALQLDFHLDLFFRQP
uniref:Uncharacterized protein n=1 Tax=Oxyrrhis marina TaxID=2969 RepID=A0A7S4GPZ5_OXYMA